MNDNLVSIVMNCHNGEKYLEESVQSILNQDYKNWELIFFDNQSDDRSLSIIKNFKDSRIKIFKSEKKLSLYNARNHAINKVNGDLISFLDTDDKWDKFFLKKLLKALIDSNFDLVYSKFFLVDENKKKKYINVKNFLPSGYITQYLLSSYNLGIIAVLFKKKIFENKKFNNSYEIIGDFDFFIESSINYKFFAVQEPLAFYRIHNDNITKKKLELYKQELEDWIKRKNNFYNKNYNLNKLKFFLFKMRIKCIINKIKNFMDR